MRTSYWRESVRPPSFIKAGLRQTHRKSGTTQHIRYCAGLCDKAVSKTSVVILFLFPAEFYCPSHSKKYVDETLRVLSPLFLAHLTSEKKADSAGDYRDR